MTTRPHPAWAARHNFNKDYMPLKDEAFKPKIYNIALEKGRFIEPCRAFYKSPYVLFQNARDRTRPDRFENRIAFDRSPYPPLDEWRPETIKKSSLSSIFDHHHVWEYREFVRYLIPREKETWVETINLSWWLSPEAGPGNKNISQ